MQIPSNLYEVKTMDKILKEILQKHGPLNSDILVSKIIKKVKKSKRTVRYQLKKIYTSKSNKWLKRHPEKWETKGDVWYYLVGQEELLEKKKFIFLKPRKDIRLDFSNLLDTWLGFLPNGNFSIKYGLYSPYLYGSQEDVVNTFFKWGTIERDVLFDEFKRYIDDILETNPEFCVNPIDEQIKLIKNFESFSEKRDVLIGEICSILINGMDLVNEAYDDEFYSLVVDIPEVIPLCIMYLLLMRIGDKNVFERVLLKKGPFIYNPIYKKMWDGGGILYNFSIINNLNSYRIKKSSDCNTESTYISIPNDDALRVNHVNLTHSTKPHENNKYRREKIWDDLEKCEKEIIRMVDESDKIERLIAELSILTFDLNTGLTNIKTALQKIKAIKI